MGNSNGKLFGKINILDLLFIIGFIMVLIVGYMYFNKSKNKAGGDKVYYTVELRLLEPGYSKLIKVGDEVKESIKDNYLGVIHSVIEENEHFINWDVNGKKYVKATSSNESRVYVRIESNASQDDYDIFAEKFVVKVGKELNIKGKGYARGGYITEMVYVKAGEALEVK